MVLRMRMGFSSFHCKRCYSTPHHGRNTPNILSCRCLPQRFAQQEPTIDSLPENV